ncbi:EAL domain-containing protein (putative c-di-GMP-specific phosphodiesterase class I)/CheY-like chemotaxis protein [Rhodopseudomonas rhenobacensis]|uniref:EAL domain-containing protein (Putative c-di-GMP-specific phosphodiesterase class I)/CheY-like chemotaxis protein n=1 Tax=Rhodopseudomonas rhenobacensis TaxID=87461 RepID=A0A7W8E2C1_9BRAD|nr:EAL domain-containing response regulator [Rhodopseudomonas rhenobacensis]MBB5049761.1 EAL domain-containing protein (putative c-di-GMP-specific phosphodiesterase class I)/CheY-like chemotaxis protein [Rhodopseudomonas rhenobacensis]
MTNANLRGAQLATFGRRKVAPRACIADSKPHLRTFLAEALEDLGFITGECAKAEDFAAALDQHLPDLVVLGSSIGGVEAGRIIEILAERGYAGHVLAISPRESVTSTAIQQMGREFGLSMLPPLQTPFSAGTLHQGVAMLLPPEPVPSPAVDVAEALKAGWLELWYQNKVDLRTLLPCGAEALVRMRHPTWGVVPPAHFIPTDDDQHFRTLSEFVINRTIADWHYLLERHGAIDLSINLPISFLANRDAVHDLCSWMPTHPAFRGLIVEVDAAEVIGNLDLLVEVAKRLRLRNIAIAIDRLGTDWPALMDLATFPFVELKVDRELINGCADDRLKQTVCRRIVELADGYGARTVATGIESRADLTTVHEIGFDVVQGYLLGRPSGLKKFARGAASQPLRLHD